MDSDDGKEKGGVTAVRKGEAMKSLEKATADYEKAKEKMKNELPGRVEIQKEETRSDDEFREDETEEI